MAKRDKAAYLGVRLLRTRLLEGRADEAPHSLLVNASEGVKVQQPLYNKNTKTKRMKDTISIRLGALTPDVQVFTALCTVVVFV